MKQLILSIFLSLWTLFCAGQDWEWQRKGGNAQVISDKGGNIYNLKVSRDSINIRKCADNGTLIWDRVLKGKFSSAVIATDVHDNLVVAGNFYDTLTSTNIQLLATGEISFYIIKFSATSYVISSKVFGSYGQTFINDLFITKSNQFLICGNYRDTSNLNGHLIPGDTFYNAYLARLDEDFNVLWSEKSSCITHHPGEKTQIDEIVESDNGNYFLTITFDFCLIKFAGHSFETSGRFLIKLDSARNFLWGSYLEHTEGYSVTNDLQYYGDTAYMKQCIDHHWTSVSILRWDSAKTSKTAWFSTDNLAYKVKDGKVFYAYVQNGDSHKKFDYRIFGVLNAGLESIVACRDSLSFKQYTIYQDMALSSDKNTFFICGEGEEIGASQFVGKFRFDFVSGVDEAPVTALRIFPNPTREIINIETDHDFIGAAYIFTSTGALALCQQLYPGHNKINISLLSRGNLIVRLVSSTGSYSERIIKE